MIKYKQIVICLLLIVSCITNARSQSLTLIDNDWKFKLGNDEQAKDKEYNDATWRTVHLPHDWGIENLPGTTSPFSPDAINGVSIGFTTGGTGWYRKWIDVTPSQQRNVLKLLFEGVYMNADIWLNGEKLGDHPYGYTSFWFDLTGKVKLGKNLLAVRVKNEGRTSRWYAGSGIYRHVWLQTAGLTHIQSWGTQVITLQATTKVAKLLVRSELVNQSGSDNVAATLVSTITDATGIVKATSTVTHAIAKDSSYTFTRNFTVANPQLWSFEKPALYTLTEEVYVGKWLVHRLQTTTGIRTVSVDAQNGFRLNGRTIKLKGGCIHQDNGPLGVAAFDRTEERRIELLKAGGFNAIRCSHNPPSPALLNACDKLGMMVIDEAFDMWADKKNAQDYHLYFNDWWQRDVESMVLRDRNHPSVIMWSTGNEIPNRDKPEVVKVAQLLSDYITQLDETRPITCGVNGVEPNKDPFFATLDVAGYNYAREKYDSDHTRLPQRVIMATESFPLESFDYWMAVKDRPFVIGDFVWTAFDYIGEASIGWLGYPQNKNFYPWNLAYCGDIDVCGWKRPQSYYRDALWKPNQLSIFVTPPVPSFSQTNPKLESWSKWNWADAVADWNWTSNGTTGSNYEDSVFTVTTYSSCEEVELLLNNKSLGKKSTSRSTKFMAVWQVPYHSGTLKAIGYTNGKKVNSSELKTAGDVSIIKLTTDRKIVKAGGQDLSYITVELTDKNGVLHPTAANDIRFEIEGPATLAGVGNANPASIESYQLPQRKAWRGKCLLIIRTGATAGDIIVKASADGLATATIKLVSK